MLKHFPSGKGLPIGKASNWKKVLNWESLQHFSQLFQLGNTLQSWKHIQPGNHTYYGNSFRPGKNFPVVKCSPDKLVLPFGKAGRLIYERRNFFPVSHIKTGLKKTKDIQILLFIFRYHLIWTSFS